MAISLGKRKRRSELVEQPLSGADADSQSDHLQKMLQRHFEARYAPLEVTPVANLEDRQMDGQPQDELHDESEDGWEGIAEDDEPAGVEVVQYESATVEDRWREKQERRRFMSNKPPSPAALSKSLSNPRAQSVGEDAAEAVNLKNDLALQRLLQESSLLKAARTDALGTMPSAIHPTNDPTTSSLALQGADRHKALDLRLQSLGAKESLFKQKKMPLPHRLGIVEKRRSKEKERRRQARENGIILERAVKERKGSTRDDAKRDRGVGGPSVGRMKGGTLVLSRRDVHDINGPQTTGGAGKKGKRRR